MTISTDKKVDIWLNHSDKMWRTAYTTPLLSAVFFAGWYTMYVANEMPIAILVLISGCFSMIIHFLIIRRMSQLDGAMSMQLKADLPKFDKPLLGLRGRHLAQAIPIFFLTSMIVVLVMTVWGTGLNGLTSASKGLLGWLNVQ